MKYRDRERDALRRLAESVLVDPDADPEHVEAALHALAAPARDLVVADLADADARKLARAVEAVRDLLAPSQATLDVEPGRSGDPVA